MVRNVFLIFIHDKLSINEVRIKVTQANVRTSIFFLQSIVHLQPDKGNNKLIFI